MLALEEPVTDITTLKDEFMRRVDEVLTEIFDADKPFDIAADEHKCEYCDYRNICRR